MPMSVPEPLLERRGPCGGGAGGQTPMAFTDGGQLDTSAVLPLLARGVRRIISMQTGGTPYRTLEQCGGDLTEGVESGLMAPPSQRYAHRARPAATRAHGCRSAAGPLRRLCKGADARDDRDAGGRLCGRDVPRDAAPV
mmetsp:Transcript_20643/g.61988  ORF Transcript_20643/g.61988 Transcript_20643/m.61988 type:complete len:139 (+) Transcript_20643:1274-1690(+)